MMDAVYILKDRSTNNYLELQYSLRTIHNLPVKGVFVVGGWPIWIKNAKHIAAFDNQKNKALNALYKVRAACEDPRVSDDFVLMNDDFYVLREPSPDQLFAYRGYIRDELANKRAMYRGSTYWQRMYKTYRLNPDMLDFALHTPLVINKEAFLQLWNLYDMDNGYLFRSIYGTEFQIGKTIMGDCKVFHVDDLELFADNVFLSSDDQIISTRKFNEFMAKFPVSKYEKKNIKIDLELRARKTFTDKQTKESIRPGQMIVRPYDRALDFIAAGVVTVERTL